MGPLDALNHLLNLFVPAVLLAGFAAAGAKVLWRRELAGVSWLRLAGPAAAVCAAVTLLGVIWSGRDGRMVTYGAMVLACALTLWWQGFGPGRR